MTKQNIGFIAPFALNILAYILVWNVFFSDTEATSNAAQNEVPAAFLEEMETTEDGVYITKENDLLLTAMNDQ
ncbi:MAG: hypothetical protein ACI8YQ_003410 [Polaribacter sp.]|jgi:hypothetical protein